MDFKELFDLRMIGDHIPVGIVIADEMGVIRYTNKASSELVGIQDHQVIGKCMYDFDGGPIGKKIDASASIQALETGRTLTSIRPNAAGVQLYSIAVPIIRMGKVRGVVMIDNNVQHTVDSIDHLMSAPTQTAELDQLLRQSNPVITKLNQQNDIDSVFVWESPAMQQVQEQIELAAASDVSILICGETGTGKEVTANQICKLGHRADSPFIKVNCAAIPENMLESELFGYEKGAFTGADPRGKPGAFELANHGTLMLDEIGEMPLRFQAKLLRAIQSKSIKRLGGTKEVPLDIRIITATNRDLETSIQAGEFRQDLYYRINVFPIKLPPLRERIQDIPALLNHFLQKYNKKYQKCIVLEREVYSKLTQYGWPGNIRELENIVERWCVIYPKYTAVRWPMVASMFVLNHAAQQSMRYQDKTLAEIVEGYERDALVWAQKEYGSMKCIAEHLGVNISTISRKLQYYGLNGKEK